MQIGGQYHAQTTIYGDIRVVDIEEVIQLCPQLVPEFHPFLYCLVLSGVGPAAFRGGRVFGGYNWNLASNRKDPIQV